MTMTHRRRRSRRHCISSTLTTLPLKNGLGSAVMSGAEYLAALASSGGGAGGPPPPGSSSGGILRSGEFGSNSSLYALDVAAEAERQNNQAEPKQELSKLGAGQLGELIIYKSGAVALQIGEHSLDVQPGTVGSCDQEVVTMSVPSKPGDPVDLHRLGKMHERLVVTPNLDHLLQKGAE